MDLAKRSKPLRPLPQRTFRRETTVPRQDTDRKRLEVNAPIRRPDMGGADELQRILGLAADTAQDFLTGKRKEAEERDAADALLDFQEGDKDDKRFANSRAYFDAYQREGAKALALDLSNEAARKVSERLNDAENPATLEDIDEVIEETIRSRTFGPDGKPLSFGSSEATGILGNALSEARERLIPQAAQAIKAQTDAKFLTTWAHNLMMEHQRGAAIGAEAKASPDPLAPLPDAGAAQETLRRPFDWEGAMGRLPPSIGRAEGQKVLFQALANHAFLTGDWSVYDGLEKSVRADGSPSFSPFEVETIVKARDQFRAKAAERVSEAQQQLQRTNAEAVVMALLEGKQPSREWLIEQAKADKLPLNFVVRIAEDMEREAEQAAREARMEQRQADIEAEDAADDEVRAEAALRRTGYLDGASPQSDLRRYERGEFGHGKRAWARLNLLRAATREGEQTLRSNPEYGIYAKRLKETYGRSGSSLLAQAHAAGVNWPAMWGHFESQVRAGKAPAEAFESAVRSYAPKSGDGRAAVAQRINELKQKRLAGGR